MFDGDLYKSLHSRFGLTCFSAGWLDWPGRENALRERFIVSATETREGTRREISVEVPAIEVQRETDALIQKYQKLARLPGFRKGHAPASIIRQRYSEDIKTEVVESLVPRYIRQEAEKKGLIPVSQPRVTDLHIHDGEPLRFKANFEVLPEIEVSGYKELRADKPVIQVTDEEVDQALNHLQEQHATFDAIEGRSAALARSSMGDRFDI